MRRMYSRVKNTVKKYSRTKTVFLSHSAVKVLPNMAMMTLSRMQTISTMSKALPSGVSDSNMMLYRKSFLPCLVFRLSEVSFLSFMYLWFCFHVNRVHAGRGFVSCLVPPAGRESQFSLRVNRNWSPWGWMFEAVIVPPWNTTAFLTIERPRPEPSALWLFSSGTR